MKNSKKPKTAPAEINEKKMSVCRGLQALTELCLSPRVTLSCEVDAGEEHEHKEFIATCLRTFEEMCHGEGYKFSGLLLRLAEEAMDLKTDS